MRTRAEWEARVAQIERDLELGRLTRQYLLNVAELQENTVPDLTDIPFAERTRETVEVHYYAQFPLLKAHDDLVVEHNSHVGSIHEPNVGGLDTLAITDLALRRIGKPPRDADDVAFAEAHIRRLQAEMATSYPSEPLNLADAVIGVEFSFAGCVLRAEDFEAMSDREQWDHVDLLVSEIESNAVEHLREALQLVLPTIYRQITADDDERRRKARMASVPTEGDLS